MFTRFHALAEETFPADRVNRMYTELEGHDALPDAPARVLAEAETFGCVTAEEPTAAQSAQLDELAAARRESRISAALKH